MSKLFFKTPIVIIRGYGALAFVMTQLKFVLPERSALVFGVLAKHKPSASKIAAR